MRHLQGSKARRLLQSVLTMFLVGALMSGCSDDPAAPGDASNNDGNNAVNNTVNNDPNNDAPVCGDGVCDGGEDTTDCPQDCETGPVCGDGVCDDGENEIDCSQDCMPMGGCGSCNAEQECVTNGTVTEICFDRDCADEQCNAGEVCFEDQCVPTSCAGLDCGGYPNVCRAGACVVGSCSDPDVRCPENQDCIEDECRARCTTQAECGMMACVDGHCQPCADSEQCGEGLVCEAEQCVGPCSDDPNRCGQGRVCDFDSGECIEACDSNFDCADGEVCDRDSGICVDGNCDSLEQCPNGQACIDNQCTPVGPEFFAGMCSGCSRMESGRFFGIGVVGPMDLTDVTATSGNFVMEPGTLTILRGTPQ